MTEGTITSPLRSLRMYALAKSMKFNHLPDEGGLYDQHPKLLEDWRYIMAEENKHEKAKRDEEEKKRESEMGRHKPPRTPSPRKPAPRRR